jgi:hypothetical protein
MKKTHLTVLLAILSQFLAACNGWVLRPEPFNPPTPFLPPTNTPSIVTATPVVIAASLTPTVQIPTPLATFTSIPFITATTAPTLIPSYTPVTPATPQATTPSGPAITVEVLGCNTSIDITHGLGEVTNAFIVLRNSGGVELTNVKATLNALDEGGDVHPDKTVEVTSLPAGYRVTLKLTVDSTYQAETPIQVEVTADPGLFQRVGSASCKDIGLFEPNPNDLTTPVPDNP